MVTLVLVALAVLGLALPVFIAVVIERRKQKDALELAGLVTSEPLLSKPFAFSEYQEETPYMGLPRLSKIKPPSAAPAAITAPPPRLIVGVDFQRPQQARERKPIKKAKRRPRR